MASIVNCLNTQNGNQFTRKLRHAEWNGFQKMADAEKY